MGSWRLRSWSTVFSVCGGHELTVSSSAHLAIPCSPRAVVLNLPKSTAFYYSSSWCGHPTIKPFQVLLHNFNFATVMNHVAVLANGDMIGSRDLQVENHWPGALCTGLCEFPRPIRHDCHSCVISRSSVGSWGALTPSPSC